MKLLLISLALVLVFCEAVTFVGCKADPDTCTNITGTYLTGTSPYISDYAGEYCATATDLKTGTAYEASFRITKTGGKVLFATNNIPNHDFNDATNPFENTVEKQAFLFNIPTVPVDLPTPMPINLEFFNGVMLNGVVLDQLSVGCCGVGDIKELTGCITFPYPWRKDPVAPTAGFKADPHNAHADADHIYHYHGDPNALYDPAGAIASPVIGFAADGYPIHGPYFYDPQQMRVRRAISGYVLKSGRRPNGSCPTDLAHRDSLYNGTYIDDYYFAGPPHGDLDECNGMTVGGHYGYYVTIEYPHVMPCWKATPDSTFHKR
jgi:hypothetical protein